MKLIQDRNRSMFYVINVKKKKNYSLKKKYIYIKIKLILNTYFSELFLNEKKKTERINIIYFSKSNHI